MMQFFSCCVNPCELDICREGRKWSEREREALFLGPSMDPLRGEVILAARRDATSRGEKKNTARRRRAEEKLQSEKMEASAETLLLFFFMRPVSLMLEMAKCSVLKRQQPSFVERREVLSNVVSFVSFFFSLIFVSFSPLFFFLSAYFFGGGSRNGTHVSTHLPVSQKTKNLMMHLHRSDF